MTLAAEKSNKAMRKLLVIISTLCLALYTEAQQSEAPWMVQSRRVEAQTEAGCPSFPSVLYGSLSYNTGCVPWDLEFTSTTMSGDVTGATYQWYRYKESDGKSTAQPCSWQTDHSTFEGFKPATDENNSRYIYYCVVTTPSCPGGTKSGKFTVVVGSDTDPCPTFSGTSFTITSGGSYSSGKTVTITATTTAYGGDHIYTWYHNGVALDTTDTRYTFVWGFNQPQLIITNVQPSDGGTYSVMMQDGTECFMYTDPVRILVDSPTCGSVPTLGVQKNAICEGESTQTGVSGGTLADGEVGKIVYMVQPDGSHPSTTVGTWTTDLPGLYQFKYVIDNPSNPSCYRESKVMTIRVYANGGDISITPSVAVEKTTNKVTFTCSPAPGTDETATVTFSSNGGQSGSVYPNTYPNFAHTCYNSGTYTYTYTITNTKAGCSRTATCEVMWYSCGWVTARFNNWVADKIKVGGSINLGPAVPTETGMIGILTVSKDGGTPEVIPTSSPYTPTDPGTYVFHYEVKHSDPRVTDCYSEVSKTIVVEPCGTAAQLSTDKTVLKLGESAKLTYNNPASGETKSMTYSLNGGTPQPLTTKPSPMTFTPTQVGEYVITYTITPSGCQATSQSVTIQVYDCGPDIDITANLTKVQPNTPVTLTLSATGADETATLTVSKDGGTPQPLTANPSPVTFTPTDEGTYVFTYTITHAYIDCSRTAQVTVRASNCGDPAGLTTDKTTLKLGESASLTLSRLPNATDGETATLTVSKDGGTQSPISNIQSPMTYTPDAVGTYVITYTISNTALGCETSSQVTIHVYDCGPEATISLSKTELKLGETVSMTLSTLGADETCSVTYSLNGGTPQPVSTTFSNPTFTPTAAGTYTLTYTITHAYIECTRSANVTLEVYDCGTPADISADKTTLKLGESANLTLSAVLPVETATLTVSKDGGTPSPVTHNPSSVTFTPDAVGTYVLTYTVSHTKISCETSDQVTIHVYDCGPDPVITIPVTEIKIMHPVTISLSAPGTDETGTLTVSINGSPQSPLGQSPITYTPSELGTYVFTYTITHEFIDCERTVTATLNVIEAELVFDDNNGTQRWSDPKNWWPSYSRIPNIADSAVIRRSCRVDIPTAQTYDLTIESAGNPSLTVLPTGALLVAHHWIAPDRANAVIIQSDATSNGALILGQDNSNIPATVDFYSRATDMSQLFPVWQYMGYPLQGEAIISQAYPKATFYQWTNTPNYKTGGNWQRVDSLAGKLSPFTGYCMTQNAEQRYLLSGTLHNPATQSIPVPYNDQGAYPGFAFVANSWVAPIDIASLTPADFGAADATVYIMNAGTYEDAMQYQGNYGAGDATARGQYNTLPINAAPYIAGGLSVIPPMQGFFVHTRQATTLTIDYLRSIYTPALAGVNTTPLRAPQTVTHNPSPVTHNPSILRLRVSGYGSEDELYILSGEQFTPRFDNGWDGYKARSENSDITMSVLTADGPMAVAALPEIDGAEITFDGGNHKTYTISAEISGNPVTDNLYLLDTETGLYTELKDGVEYSFKCGAATRRFVITRRANQLIPDNQDPDRDQPIKFIDNGLFYIRIGTRLYNGTGNLLLVE